MTLSKNPLLTKEKAGTFPQMANDKLQQVDIEKLIPYARNAKRHSDEQVAQLAASIREFGFNSPVLIDGQHGIIAGHGRVLAARKLELKTVPCIVIDHLSDTQKKAYILADNRLGELGGGWDEEMLGLELSDLRETDFDLNLVGFDGAAIERFLNPPEPEQAHVESPEDFPEADEDIDTQHECPKCGYAWSGKSK